MEAGDENFPSMQDGDVKIVLGASRIHQVDSKVLTWATKFGRVETDEEKQEQGAFSVLLAPERAVSLSNKAMKRGVSTRYHLVATDLTRDENGRFNLELTPVPLDDEGRPLERIKPHLGLETGQRPPAVYDAFAAILGSFYDEPINLGGAHEPIRDRVHFAIHMIDLAESLGVKYCIAPEVVNALNQPPPNGAPFWNVVAQAPEFWLDFAYRIKSRKVYHEALVHAAGRFQTAKMKAVMFSMTDETHSTVEQKAQDIKERVKKLFHNILSYYPPELHRTAVTGYVDTDNIGRNSYSNDIFLWMALTIYRHFISQEAITVIDNEDMGYDLISRIGKGGDHYFTMTDCGPFFQFFPITAKARDVVEKKIKEIKDHVRPWTDGLLRNNAELDPRTHREGFFTCAQVEEEDYPFEEVGRDF